MTATRSETVARELVNNAARSAVLSPDGVYRYELRRTWDPNLPTAGWIMLNPSTADDQVDDPTIRRCTAFAHSWGYGGIVVRNLYALRSTDPSALRGHPDPVGPDNDAHLAGAALDAVTVCAWGDHHGIGDRITAVTRQLTTAGAYLAVLGWTQRHLPRHPLYLRRDLTPIPWTPP